MDLSKTDPFKNIIIIVVLTVNERSTIATASDQSFKGQGKLHPFKVVQAHVFKYTAQTAARRQWENGHGQKASNNETRSNHPDRFQEVANEILAVGKGVTTDR